MMMLVLMKIALSAQTNASHTVFAGGIILQ